MEEMKLHEFIKQEAQDRVVSVKETQLRNYVTQMKMWEQLAENNAEEIRGLKELVNALRVQVNERESVLIDLGV